MKGKINKERKNGRNNGRINERKLERSNERIEGRKYLQEIGPH
jgi:hypothetical protein